MPGAEQASTCLRQTASPLPRVPWTMPHLSLPDSSLPAQLSSSLPRVTRTVTEHICTWHALEGTELVGARQKPSLQQQSCVHRFSQCLTTGALCLDALCCQPPPPKHLLHASRHQPLVETLTRFSDQRGHWQRDEDSAWWLLRNVVCFVGCFLFVCLFWLGLCWFLFLLAFWQIQQCLCPAAWNSYWNC